MVDVSIEYRGELRTTVTHGPSGQKIATDAPIDNQGRGEYFSPTDLVAAALGSCIATLMGIYAKKHGIDLAGLSVHVEKHMNAEPRRIGRLPVVIDVPLELDERHRSGIETMARHCPVHKSLHPDIDSPMTFRYRKSQ